MRRREKYVIVGSGGVNLKAETIFELMGHGGEVKRNVTLRVLFNPSRTESKRDSRGHTLLT